MWIELGPYNPGNVKDTAMISAMIMIMILEEGLERSVLSYMG